MGIPFQLGFEGNKRNVSDSGNMRIFLDEPSSASCLPKVFSLPPPFLLLELIQCFQTSVTFLSP